MCGEEWESLLRRSGERSRASEGETMCARPLIARESSGAEEELRSYVNRQPKEFGRRMGGGAFLIKFVVNINTSVSARKLCTAAKYPTRFCRNLGELITSSAWKLAHDMSCPNMSRYINFSTAVALISAARGVSPSSELQGSGVRAEILGFGFRATFFE